MTERLRKLGQTLAVPPSWYLRAGYSSELPKLLSILPLWWQGLFNFYSELISERFVAKRKNDLGRGNVKLDCVYRSAFLRLKFGKSACKITLCTNSTWPPRKTIEWQAQMHPVIKSTFFIVWSTHKNLNFDVFWGSNFLRPYT